MGLPNIPVSIRVSFCSAWNTATAYWPLGMPLKTALGTSLAAIVVLVIPGTIVHAALGNIDWQIVAVLVVGSVIGARIGAGIALGASERTLRVVVASFLVACGPIYKTPKPTQSETTVAVVAAPLPANVAAGGAHVCKSGDTCNEECDQGNCAFICEAGSTCNFECDGGNCMINCEAGSTCNHDCDGGNCRTLCDGGATCNLECDGGNCQQACEAGATCNRECDGGNCDS